jgi:hypothetical protein
VRDYVFISYAREDQEYTRALVAFLWGQGIDAWIDAGLDFTDEWREVVMEKIDGCSAMIVIMTAAAEDSKWVNREINRANEKNKPILTLLLQGAPLFQLNGLQYEDVTGGGMPGVDFLDRLRRLMWAGGPNAAIPGEERWRVSLIHNEQMRTARGAMAEVARSRADRPDGRRSVGAYNAIMLLMAVVAVVVALSTVNQADFAEARMAATIVALWPAVLAAALALTIMLVSNGLARSMTERSGRIGAMPYDFAFWLEEPVDPVRLKQHMERRTRARTSRGLRLINLGRARVDRMPDEATVIQLRALAIVRVRGLRYARFDVATDILLRQVAGQPKYLLAQCRVFGESPASIRDSTLSALLRAVLTNVGSLTVDGALDVDAVLAQSVTIDP